MDKLKNALLILLTIAIIGLFVDRALSLLGLYEHKPESPVAEANVRTDTTQIHNHYIMPKVTQPSWNPQFVLNYPTLKPDTQIKYVLSDSLLEVIDSLKGVNQKYNLAFLSNFPKNSKLIHSTIKLDSLKLDLLFPDGSIQTQGYHIDLTRYSYEYQDNQLTYKSIKPKRLLKTDVYLQGSYDFLSNSPAASIRPQISLGKTLVYAEAKKDILNPNFRLELGVGFKVK